MSSLWILDKARKKSARGVEKDRYTKSRRPTLRRDLFKIGLVLYRVPNQGRGKLLPVVPGGKQARKLPVLVIEWSDYRERESEEMQASRGKWRIPFL